MLDDWVRFWDLDGVRYMHILVVGNMDGFVVRNWDWDFLDDCQSLFLMSVMVTTAAAAAAASMPISIVVNTALLLVLITFISLCLLNL